MSYLPFGRSGLSARRRGQALIEFAIVAIALYLVIAIVLTFGHAFFVAQVLQQSTDLLAHELAETPLPAMDNMNPASPAYAIADPTVQSKIFDTTADGLQFIYSNTAYQNWANQSAQQQTGQDSLIGYFEWSYASSHQGRPLPIINQLLIPLMIIENTSSTNLDQLCLTYPGIEWDSPTSYVPYVYRLVNDGTVTGSVERVPVVEGLTATNDLFPLSATGTGGIAAVRLNYPFQSAALSSFTTNDPTTSTPIQASAGDVSSDPDFNSITPPSIQGGLYGGQNHLGIQAVGKLYVRPYQRIISGQAAYRREVFSPAAAPGGGQ